MKEPDYAKLVEYRRNGLVEQIHFGLVIHMNQNGLISKAGEDNAYKFYHRSCMKPLQASALSDLGLDKKYNLSLKELAVCTASHAGDLVHQNNILSVLKKAGFSEDDLLLKPHEPLSKKERIRLIKNGLEPEKIHHNCSGKHSAMLAICKEKDFPVKNYKDFDKTEKLITYKKYLYSMRGLLNAKYVTEFDKIPPLIFTKTVEQLKNKIPQKIYDKLYEIIKIKSSGLEKDTVLRIPELDEYLESELNKKSSVFQKRNFDKIIFNDFISELLINQRIPTQ